MKRENPYNRLKRICREWASNIKYRHRKEMWYYPKNKLSQGWTLNDLYERTLAAEQLGYDVILKANESGLHIEYIKKIPEEPWELKY